MHNRLLVPIVFLASALACTDSTTPEPVREDPATFREIASQDLGGTGASEISAYDPETKRLFTVNNESAAKIDILDLSGLPTVRALPSIDVSRLGGVANSVDVSGGKLAIALESIDKQQNGSVVVLNTSTLATIRQVTVGALPDMVTFSPDGRFIITANEGEPNTTYTNDPVGSISIIDVNANYSVRTVDFSALAGQQTQLAASNFRIFGPRASFSQDIEPEYVAVSGDSRRAWVTLQENNGIAEVDLVAGSIVRIWPLGTKDYSLAQNAIDPSDRDNAVRLGTWPIRSLYMPDAISFFQTGGSGYVITANEGDGRDYTAIAEEVRIGSLTLDATAFPNAATLRQTSSLGRLRVTNTAGDTDRDGDYDVLFGFGGRGFSIYETATGRMVYESGKSLEEAVIAGNRYDDERSDDKGVEPEGVVVGQVSNRPIAFIGLERADAVAVYDLSNPTNPQFLQLLATGDAPEGLHFIPASKSPTGQSLLVVSSEGDGTVKIYQPNKLP